MSPNNQTKSPEGHAARLGGMSESHVAESNHPSNVRCFKTTATQCDGQIITKVKACELYFYSLESDWTGPSYDHLSAEAIFVLTRPGAQQA